jgi:predicted RNA-binding Zn-ribbon protein involved in translation (DUF1610 family)
LNSNYGIFHGAERKQQLFHDRKERLQLSEKKHVPLPKETPAFFCANCGAVSLDTSNICKVMGRGRKADWCGSKGVKPPSFCHNKRHNNRWQCQNCGTVAVNPELLCEPEKLPVSE